MADHLVQGQRITMPVEIREAAACSAMFVVPAAAARSVVDYSGLDIVEPVRGRAICSLAFVRYIDGDLGAYHEFAVSFLVRHPGGSVGAFIHWLPVDQPFTLEAGRSIWGFPKELADIDLQLAGRSKRCTVRKDGQLVADLLIKPGLPVPSRSAETSVDAYSHLDGVTRRTAWRMRPAGVRSRPGGAVLVLGEHPVAKELKGLGLPKRAIFTSSIRQLRMTFADAERVATP
jgi:hypothetical protein